MAVDPNGLEEALVAMMLGDEGLHTLVADRITWVKRTQGKPLPAITLNRVAGEGPLDTLDGQTSLQRAIVQVDHWGATYGAAKVASRATRTLFASPSDPRFTGLFVQAERDFYEPAANGQSDIHRTSLDVEVWFQPS